MPTEVLPVIVDGETRADGRLDLLVLGGGFQHGEGLFETLPVLDGKPILVKAHLSRLNHGAEMLGLIPTPTEAEWMADVQALVSVTGESSLATRLFLVRDGDRVRRVVAANRLPTGDPLPARVGIVPCSPRYHRPFPSLKTMNYLGPRHAHALGATAGMDDMLYVDEHEVVWEGTRSTVFMVKDSVVFTAPLSLPILPGVTRDMLLQVANKAGISIKEQAFTLEDLRGADEGFLSASLKGVRPLAEVDGTRLPACPGPLTQQLADIYQQAVLPKPF